MGGGVRGGGGIYIYVNVIPLQFLLAKSCCLERVYPHFEYLDPVVLNKLSTLSCWLVQRQFQFVTGNDAGIMVF